MLERDMLERESLPALLSTQCTGRTISASSGALFSLDIRPKGTTRDAVGMPPCISVMLMKNDGAAAMFRADWGRPLEVLALPEG